jgi:uncharacterized protein
MRALVNIRHLENNPVHLQDTLSVQEMDIDPMDVLIQIEDPLEYDIEVQLVDRSVLAQGTLELKLRCACARCLKSYVHTMLLDEWAAHLPLEGDDRVPVINDRVDLTPFIREDILLAFPQQPLCEPTCKGLIRPSPDSAEGANRDAEAAASTWAELNKLKL